MWTIYKKGSFESAHLLEGHPQCGKLHVHSYNWEVWIQNDVLQDPYGFILDFHLFKQYFDQFDHSNIAIKMSAEEIAREAYKYFKKQLPTANFIRVRIWETASCYAEYEQ